MIQIQPIAIYPVSNGIIVELPAPQNDSMLRGLGAELGPMISDLQAHLQKDPQLAEIERKNRSEKKDDEIKLGRDKFTFIFPTMKEALAFLSWQYGSE